MDSIHGAYPNNGQNGNKLDIVCQVPSMCGCEACQGLILLLVKACVIQTFLTFLSKSFVPPVGP